MTSLRSALERCYLWNDNERYKINCLLSPGLGRNDLDIEDPTYAPNSHFVYYVAVPVGIGDRYEILATRNTRDGGIGCEPFDPMAGTPPFCNSISCENTAAKFECVGHGPGDYATLKF